MEPQPVNTSESTSTSGSKSRDEDSVMETMLDTADDISNQNQTAQLFFEALLQSSRSQLLSDSGLSNVDEVWPSGRLDISHDSHMDNTIQQSAPPTVRDSDCMKMSYVPSMSGSAGIKQSSSPNVMATDSMKMSYVTSVTANSSGLKKSKSPNVGGTDSVKVVSPLIPKLPVKQSTTPIGVSVSPKKRSRRQTTGTMDYQVKDEMMDCSSRTDVLGRQQVLERSVSESDTMTAPRRRGSHLDGGRRSRTQSESENDGMSDPISMMNTYPSDDVRRQMTGSVTPETDVGFQPSMLDAVLTEKKLALLRSPEIRQFLNQQQAQRAKERKLTHSSQTSGSKGDNSS